MPGFVALRGRTYRGAITAVVAAAGLAVHLTVQRLAPPPIAHAGGWLVEWTPFLPWTVWIYLAFFPFLVLTGALAPAGRWWRLIAAWSIASVATWALVLLVPISFARPELAALGPLDGRVFGLVYGLDGEHVTFPCLHAALTWISWVALAEWKPRWRLWTFALALAITLSTMTTRQHLVTDNAAGIVIAVACLLTARPGPGGAG